MRLMSPIFVTVFLCLNLNAASNLSCISLFNEDPFLPNSQKFLSDSIVLKGLLNRIVQPTPLSASLLKSSKVITENDIELIFFEFATHQRLTGPSLARLMNSFKAVRIQLDANEIALMTLLMDRYYADSKFLLFTNGEDSAVVNFSHWRVTAGKSLDIPMSMTTDGQPLRPSGFKLMFQVERVGFDKARDNLPLNFFSVKIKTDWGRELVFATGIPINPNHSISITNQSVKIIEANGKFYFVVSFKILKGYKFEQHQYTTEIPADFLQ